MNTPYPSDFLWGAATAAHQVEGEDLAERVRVDDQTVQPDTDQSGRAKAVQGCSRHGCGGRLAGPATSSPRVAAIETVMAASMSRISGFARPGG